MSAKEPFSRQAAKLCWVAPLIAIGMNLFGSNPAMQHPAATQILGGVSAIFFFSGPVFGIIALLGMRRHGTNGILKPVLAGMALFSAGVALFIPFYALVLKGQASSIEDLAMRKGMFGTWECREKEPGGEVVTWLALAPDGKYELRMTGAAFAAFSGTWSIQHARLYLLVTDFVAGKREAIGNKMVWLVDEVGSENLVLRDAKRPFRYIRNRSADGRTLDDLERDYFVKRWGYFDFPGWWGSTQIADSRIVVCSLDDEAPLPNEFTALFTTKTSLLQVVVDNLPGKVELVIDPASARLFAPDAAAVKAFAPETILQTAKGKKEPGLDRFAGNIRVPAGRQCTDRVLFIPRGTRLANITHITVTVNGREVEIPGQFLTVEEKKEMLQQAPKAPGNPVPTSP